MAYLSVAIEKHEMKKEYICLCKGVFSKSRGSISFPIGKDRHSDKQIVCSSGKEAKISKDSSKIALYVIPTNEELIIARDTANLVG